jgi:hypothetical protein
MNASVAPFILSDDRRESLSKLVRSNTGEFWTHMKRRADLSSLAPYLPFEGVLAGDPHLGNFSVMPVKAAGGARKMRFVDIDFDDAGRGPFVLDFVRYLIASKSIRKQIKKRPLEKSYLAGLAGKALKPPKQVRDLLAMPVSQYDEMAAQYAEHHSSTSGFILKKGAIEAYNGKKITRSTIERLFAGESVVDVARRPEVSGGSEDQLRIWVLIAGRQSRRIMELKQYAKPTTAGYRQQPPVGEWLKEVRRAFWPGLDGSAYDLVKIPGAGLFWRREKHVSLIDVPYSSGKGRNIAFVEALAAYDANVLGLAHGRQPQAKRYRAEIEKDPDAFHDAINPVVKAYLALARKNLRDK